MIRVRLNHGLHLKVDHFEAECPLYGAVPDHSSFEEIIECGRKHKM